MEKQLVAEQLLESLRERLLDAAERPESHPTLTYLRGRQVKFVFPFQRRRVDLVRAIAGRRYHPEEKFWTVGVDGLNVEQVLRVIAEGEFRLDREAYDLLQLVHRESEGLRSAELANVERSHLKASDLEIAGLGGELRPFQKAGVEYVARTERCFIADEMGLGKTVQALATIEFTQSYPAVVVCPASLKLNWRKEAASWLPPERTLGLYPPPKKKEAIGDAREVGHLYADVTIVNYATLARFVAEVSEEAVASLREGRGQMRPLYEMVVFDESHYLKNGRSARTKAAKSLVQDIARVVMLSGTPILNAPKELLAQLTILGRLQEMGGYLHFVQRYCGAKRQRWGMDINGATNLAELALRLRGLCYIRREKHEVLTELPAKQRTQVPVVLANGASFSKVEKQFTARLARLVRRYPGVARAVEAPDPAGYREARGEVLTTFNQLRMLTGEGKLAACIDWIKNFLQGEEKLVVFAYHREVLQRLVDELSEVVETTYILGHETAQSRQNGVDRFQQDPNCRVIVCSILAAGVGVTLTAAANVCFVEMGWTPAVHLQAEDRCHRMGQRQAVNCWYFYAENSLDAHVFKVLNRKQEMLAELFGASAPESLESGSEQDTLVEEFIAGLGEAP